jgi:hypothetical protein
VEKGATGFQAELNFAMNTNTYLRQVVYCIGEPIGGMKGNGAIAEVGQNARDDGVGCRPAALRPIDKEQICALVERAFAEVIADREIPGAGVGGVGDDAEAFVWGESTILKLLQEPAFAKNCVRIGVVGDLTPAIWAALRNGGHGHESWPQEDGGQGWIIKRKEAA